MLQVQARRHHVEDHVQLLDVDRLQSAPALLEVDGVVLLSRPPQREPRVLAIQAVAPRQLPLDLVRRDSDYLFDALLELLRSLLIQMVDHSEQVLLAQGLVLEVLVCHAALQEDDLVLYLPWNFADRRQAVALEATAVGLLLGQDDEALVGALTLTSVLLDFAGVTSK